MIEIKKSYKSESAADILREAILAGDIPGGTELKQNELAASLRISRMPVREALITLEYQGLVEHLPNQHARSVAMSEDHIRSVFTDLANLEIEALKTFSDEERNELSLTSGQLQFHRRLYGMLHASLRKKMLETLVDVYLAFVLENSGHVEKIEPVFQNTRLAIKDLSDISVAKMCYVIYSEVLANELIKIRRENKIKCLT